MPSTKPVNISMPKPGKNNKKENCRPIIPNELKNVH